MLLNFLAHSRLFLVLAFSSLIIGLFDSISLLALPKLVLQQITVPIQYGLYQTSLSLSKQFEFVILARRAAQQNKALTEQLAQILSENASLRRRLAEAEGRLVQAQALNPQNFRLVAARPIGISRYLLIDKGADDGLKIGQAVVYKDTFLGKVTKVSAKRAQVLLVSDPDLKISAFAASAQGKARGVLTGQFGQEITLEKILHQEPVQVNDLVYSEGTEGEVPRGLILGVVTQVLSRDNELFKKALVKPVFEVASLDIVFVITD